MHTWILLNLIYLIVFWRSRLPRSSHLTIFWTHTICFSSSGIKVRLPLVNKKLLTIEACFPSNKTKKLRDNWRESTIGRSRNKRVDYRDFSLESRSATLSLTKSLHQDIMEGRLGNLVQSVQSLTDFREQLIDQNEGSFLDAIHPREACNAPIQLFYIEAYFLFLIFSNGSITIISTG
jgi:hypothetical protein